MWIDKILPDTVEAKGTLREKLLSKCFEVGLSSEQADLLIASVPAPLINAGAFLDKMTNQWRYEYGIPFEIGGTLVWGTHMWLPVEDIYNTLVVIQARLSEDQSAVYLARLNDPERHASTLVEMIPGHRIASSAQAEFEVTGYGEGHRTVDWMVHGRGRKVLLEVKCRTIDFIKQMESETGETEIPPPEHDAALLLRSVDTKFLPADPDVSLQGAFITTHIKQNETKLNAAFAALDPDKVHFVLLGDWLPDVHVIARREIDRDYLYELFRSVPSDRFTFKP
jgi:hypothetical protein